MVPVKDHALYYCWHCDAHRPAALEGESAPCCPHCGNMLPTEAKLSAPLKHRMHVARSVIAPQLAYFE
jgi:hypothetical protein